MIDDDHDNHKFGVVEADKIVVETAGAKQAAQQLAEEQEEVAGVEAERQFAEEHERAAHIPFVEYSVYGKIPES